MGAMFNSSRFVYFQVCSWKKQEGSLNRGEHIGKVVANLGVQMRLQLHVPLHLGLHAYALMGDGWCPVQIKGP